MAPDKIHIDEDLINYHCLADHLNEEEITYIRKSALLEWANARKECGASLISLDTLIDKLNSF